MLELVFQEFLSQKKTLKTHTSVLRVYLLMGAIAFIACRLMTPLFHFLSKKIKQVFPPICLAPARLYLNSVRL